MVGDDIETDVLAAQRQGLTGVLVKNGKYLRARTAPPPAPRPCPRLLRRPATLLGQQSYRTGERITRSPAACQRRCRPVTR